MSKKVIRKIVDIYPNGPIYTVIPPIMGNAFKVDLPVGDIANCINSRAIVTETLIDGRTISIGLSNYDIDNNEGITLPEEKKETTYRESAITTNKVEEEIEPVEEVVEEELVEEVVEEEPAKMIEETIVEPEPVEPSIEEEIEKMVESRSEGKYQSNNKGKNKGR